MLGIITKFNQFLKKIYKKITNLKFISVAIVVIVIMFFLGLGTYKFSTSPNTCKLCHEMKPEYATWINSPHKNFTCIDCHYENKLKDNLKTVMVNVYKHFSDDYPKPIELKGELNNEVCLSCHSLNRRVSSTGDLEFDHQKHLNKGYRCNECHVGAIHGKISEKGYTLNSNYDKWTVSLGKAYMKSKLTTVTMEQCMNCHQDKNVNTKCADCHKDIGNPRDHLDKNWISKHGAKARKDLRNCNSCHYYSMSYRPVNYTDDQIANYARNNKFCSNCHLGENRSSEQMYLSEEIGKDKPAYKLKTGIEEVKKAGKLPPSHTDSWRLTHQNRAKSDSKGCYVCHDDNRSSLNGATGTYCAKCHKGHTLPNEVGSHPVPLQGQSFGQSCLKCHPSRSCGKCHYIK